MAHLTSRSAWTRLVDRLNRHPQGAPPSELLYDILRMLFTEEEAGLVALLPIRPFTAARAARAWKTTPAKARVVLDRLADRGILLDWEANGDTTWVLPPPMAGFFEFSMMRVRGDVDQPALAELFYRYLNVEEDFVRELFATGETQLGRTFVNEDALGLSPALHVLDYERASEVIRTAKPMAVGLCYCRHKMAHLGRACDAPMDICMTFDEVADSLIRHEIARSVEPAEGLDLLAEAKNRRLVQFGTNVREDVGFICNCCGCCCEAMLAARRFGHLNPVHTTNYLPAVDREACRGCGKCAEACPVEAIAVVSANDPARPRRRAAKIDELLCLGCGVCVTVCERDALRLEARGERVVTPLNSAHRIVMMAIERGKLAELIIDEQALTRHRVMAAILGTILRLPPLKQALASRQFRSRYLERLLAGRPVKK